MPDIKSRRKSPRREAPQKNRWPFRLAALALIPLLALAMVEGALRLAGYGYPTGFWEKDKIGGKEFFVNNEEFSLRFFPPQLARWSQPVRIAAQKSPATFRIFIMGESAAQGDPEPAYGAGRYLEALLCERYPAANFEVANVAFTAINSHVIVPIARDCARRQGDLWIVYMGNNEMIGPFGAATVFGIQAPPLALVRLNLALQRLRLGQWITEMARKLRGSGARESWGGMEMFMGNQLAPSDSRRKVVDRNFQANLRDIVQAGLNSGAKILLNTVAVNLRDCPPFASVSDPGGAPDARAACDQLRAQGAAAQESGHFLEASQLFEQAARLDASRADLQYRWAQCLAALANPAASRHFQNACDYDALPFRADSVLNGIIRAEALRDAGPNLVLCDAAAAFEKEPDISSNLFYEHVHLNFDGNYRLARMWADKTEAFLPPEIQSRPAGAWASQAICERRLGLTDLYRVSIFDGVIARMQQPPLSSQRNNGARMAALRTRVKELRQQPAQEARAQAREICADAIGRAPDDYILHEVFGAVLQGMGDLKAATLQWHEARELMPRDRFAFLSEGQLLERQGQLAQARDACRQAAALYPKWADAWIELGKIDALEDNYEAALVNYKRALQVQPGDARIYFFIGRAFSRLKRPAESIESLRHAVQIKPDYAEAHFALGGELGGQNEFSQARSEFEEAVKLQPGHVLAHLNLGVALMKLEQWEAARKQFAETLRLDPNNTIARNFLAQAQALQTSRH